MQTANFQSPSDRRPTSYNTRLYRRSAAFPLPFNPLLIAVLLPPQLDSVLSKRRGPFNPLLIGVLLPPTAHQSTAGNSIMPFNPLLIGVLLPTEYYVKLEQ